MKTPQEIQQFIIDTLLPYREDKSLCAMEGNICVYLSTDENKCAVGKHLKDNKEVQDFRGDVFELFSKFGADKILTDEAKEYPFNDSDWRLMQEYHDNLAQSFSASSVNTSLEKLQKKYKIDLSILKLD